MKTPGHFVTAFNSYVLHSKAGTNCPISVRQKCRSTSLSPFHILSFRSLSHFHSCFRLPSNQYFTIPPSQTLSIAFNKLDISMIIVNHWRMFANFARCTEIQFVMMKASSYENRTSNSINQYMVDDFF